MAVIAILSIGLATTYFTQRSASARETVAQNWVDLEQVAMASDDSAFSRKVLAILTKAKDNQKINAASESIDLYVIATLNAAGILAILLMLRLGLTGSESLARPAAGVLGSLAGRFQSLRHQKDHIQRMLNEKRPEKAASSLPASSKEVAELTSLIDQMALHIRNMRNNFDNLSDSLTKVYSSSFKYKGSSNLKKQEWDQFDRSIREMVVLAKAMGKSISDSDNLQKAANNRLTTLEKSQKGITAQLSVLFENIGNLEKSSSQAVKKFEGLTSSSEESLIKLKKVTELVAGLVEKSDAIVDIIDVIDDIAEQTNLLALNASIEAARAGEQGQGFAVVAEEVRKLAARSSTATRSITDLVQSIQANADTASKDLSLSIESVEGASEQVTTLSTDTASSAQSIKRTSLEIGSLQTMLKPVFDGISEVHRTFKDASSISYNVKKSSASLNEKMAGTVVSCNHLHTSYSITDRHLTSQHLEVQHASQIIISLKKIYEAISQVVNEQTDEMEQFRAKLYDSSDDSSLPPSMHSQHVTKEFKIHMRTLDNLINAVDGFESAPPPVASADASPATSPAEAPEDDFIDATKPKDGGDIAQAS